MTPRSRTKRTATKTTESTEEPAAADLSAFAELGLIPELLDAVRDAGYTIPTPIQGEAIPVALRGRDIIGLAQTGTGKTAGFTLPIIQRLLEGRDSDDPAKRVHRVRALILTPTRELCVRVEESFKKYGRHSDIRVVSIYGGVPLEPQQTKLRKGVDVVVATPGRLLDHMERQNVVFDDLEILVLDEADRMLDMGFAPQLYRIVAEIPATDKRCCSAPPCRPRSRRSRESICASRSSFRSGGDRKRRTL